MKLIEKHKSLTATVIIIAATAVIAVLVYIPGQEKSQALREQLRGKRASITRAIQAKASATRLDKELHRAREFTGQWKDRAPNENRMPQTFGQIFQSAQQSGATIAKFEPQTATALHTIRQVPLSLTSRGTYSQITKLLLAIEQLPMTVWIDSLRFTPSRENTQHIECEAALVLFADKTSNSD